MRWYWVRAWYRGDVTNTEAEEAVASSLFRSLYIINWRRKHGKPSGGGRAGGRASRSCNRDRRHSPDTTRKRRRVCSRKLKGRSLYYPLLHPPTITARMGSGVNHVQRCFSPRVLAARKCTNERSYITAFFPK